ncbi:hypothetical protein N7454_002116 [Penicillium verhagenii]|nr:hypothetical protein N7454_002116 [Penicillium verhagenii]
MAELWYCCHCAFGPHNSSLYVACISCNRPRCSRCKAEKAVDSLHAHGHSHSNYHSHETSPYPSAVNMSTTYSSSFGSNSMLPAGTDLPQIRSLRPGLATGPQPFPFGESRVTTRGPTYMYICCGCGDGPKVYNVQPRCTECQHSACGGCTYVK